MLQLLKIVFTFGKELLIAHCQSGSCKLTKRSRGYKPFGLRLAFLQRQQEKRRVLGSKIKYWIENIWKKHEHVLVRTAERENNKRKDNKERCRRKLIQVTNITRSNRDKSPYNVNIKDKTGVLTCGQFKSVNNHSERRAKFSRSRHFPQKYCLAKQTQILRVLDSFSLLLCVTSHLYQGSFFK